jgi:hypothetical protein
LDDPAMGENVRDGALMPVPLAQRAALQVVCHELPLHGLAWALTGSTGHRLQGVPVGVHDIDIQTDDASFDGVAARLARYVVDAPALRESELMRSMCGTYFVAGVTVELMGGIRKRARDVDPWGTEVDVVGHRRVVRLGDLLIPVLDLAHEAEAYEAIGRHDRAVLLRKYAAGTS